MIHVGDPPIGPFFQCSSLFSGAERLFFQDLSVFSQNLRCSSELLDTLYSVSCRLRFAPSMICRCDQMRIEDAQVYFPQFFRHASFFLMDSTYIHVIHICDAVLS